VSSSATPWVARGHDGSHHVSSLDPLKVLVPAAGLFQSRLMLVANNSLGAGNSKEFLSAAEGKSGPLLLWHVRRRDGAPSRHGIVQGKDRDLDRPCPLLRCRAHHQRCDQRPASIRRGESAAAGVPQVRSTRIRAIAMLSTSNIAGAENIAVLRLPAYEYEVCSINHSGCSSTKRPPPRALCLEAGSGLKETQAARWRVNPFTDRRACLHFDQ
jgi:hypothetical protein